MSMLLTRHYKPVEIKEETQASEIDLSKLKVDELKAMAKSKGLEGYSSLTKAELIELIERV